MLSNNVDSSDPIPEIRDELIALLERFVHLIASHATIDLQETPKFKRILHELCEAAPDVARAIAGTIQGNKTVPSEQQVNANTALLKRKWKPDQDPPYRPSKSTRISGSSAYLAKSIPTADCRGLETERPIMDDDEARPTVTMASEDMLLMETPASRGPENAVPDAELMPPAGKTPDAGQIEKKSSTQPKVYQEKVLVLAESSSSSRQSPADSSIMEASPIQELIVDAARTLYQLSQHQDGIPKAIHRRILRSLQGSQPEALAASTSNTWSDGSIWVQLLEMGSSRQRHVMILNMLEYMGAWEWYDGQVRLAQRTISTKKGQPVDRRGAAIHVLNEMQTTRGSVEGRGRWMSGVGMVALNQSEPSHELPSSPVSLAESDQRQRRKLISMQLSRGQKLSTKLVKNLGFGILFSKKIWHYTKMSMKRLDDLIHSIQADPQHTRLLQILGLQLERLVSHGWPDFRDFITRLTSGGLISEDEAQELRITFPLEDEALPAGKLDTAIDQLVEGVKARVLGQTILSPNDTLAVNGSMELECTILQHLRPGVRLDAWTILAAMQISDRPAFVRHDKSIPLDEIIAIQPVKRIRPFKRPLAAWAKKISKYRRQAKETFGEVIPLVFFCPINHTDSHYTLLEINERERVIRHYDSLADRGAVGQTRMSRLVQEEFGALKFSYQEAPTPQQNDAWSCGIRVVWTFQRLSNGLPIGGWDKVLNPEPMILEIINGLVTCVEENAMERYQR